MREKQKHSGSKLGPNHKSSWNRLLNFNSEIIKIYFKHINIYIYTAKNTHNFRSPQKSPTFPIFCSSLPSSKKSKQNKQKNRNFFDPDEKCPRSPRLPSFEVFVAIEGVTGSSLKSSRGVGHDGCLPFWKTTRKVGPPKRKPEELGIFLFLLTLNEKTWRYHSAALWPTWSSIIFGSRKSPHMIYSSPEVTLSTSWNRRWPQRHASMEDAWNMPHITKASSWRFRWWKRSENSCAKGPEAKYLRAALAASMVRVSFAVSNGKCIEIPPHGLPELHHRKSVCLRASPESSARPHCRLPGSSLWKFRHLVHVQKDSVPLPCWFTNAYGYNEPFRFSSPSASRTSSPKAPKTFHSKGALEIQ